jgi:hypothetical protein
MCCFNLQCRGHGVQNTQDHSGSPQGVWDSHSSCAACTTTLVLGQLLLRIPVSVANARCRCVRSSQLTIMGQVHVHGRSFLGALALDGRCIGAAVPACQSKHGVSAGWCWCILRMPWPSRVRSKSCIAVNDDIVRIRAVCTGSPNNTLHMQLPSLQTKTVQSISDSNSRPGHAHCVCL